MPDNQASCHIYRTHCRVARRACWNCHTLQVQHLFLCAKRWYLARFLITSEQLLATVSSDLDLLERSLKGRWPGRGFWQSGQLWGTGAQWRGCHSGCGSSPKAHLRPKSRRLPTLHFFVSFHAPSESQAISACSEGQLLV